MNSKVKVLILLLCATGVCMLLRGYVPLYTTDTVSYTIPQLLDTRPCACEKCLSEDDPRFMQRFHKSIQPFLSANYSITEDAFDWWKRLQLEGHSFNTYKATVDNLFRMFPPSPDLIEPRSDRCRTCAVVGNSGNLKGSHYGAMIDSLDVIIRMNFGHTKGFETDVGTRTTHRVMYPESATDLDNTTHLILFPFKIQDIEWLTKAFTTGFYGRSYQPVRSKVKANKDLVMVISPAFMRYVHDIWLEKKGRYPSTGFMTLILSLHICDEVHVFGFGADKDGNWNHYWEELRDRSLKTGIHPGNHEYGIIQELAEQQKVKFYRGW